MKNPTKILLGVTALAGGLAFMAFRPQNEPLETVAYVDLQKYMGTWYEIAAFPQRFQKGCHCTKAEYKMHPEGYVEVKNSCRKNSATGKLDTATGKATIKDKKTNAKLKVQFFWPFKGDYWIIDLAEDYSYAVVGAPNREYLWILSRQKQMDQALYQKIVARIQAKGFDVSRLVLSDQSCN
ncbi:lipocalin family protein [Adhaeribacter sp. BT258]|uniref:Lipocalin family protein n=1 Tax=Adhaeribacter terrigena TaxID=2793070 RepID=A0ABS1C5J3_9BACT|nr:lipocalin family protein [Adhaeribacter terrigena]MBK0404481.1 lipocalin family protein [Adhaeribacter terrigena]